MLDALHAWNAPQADLKESPAIFLLISDVHIVFPAFLLLFKAGAAMNVLIHGELLSRNHSTKHHHMRIWHHMFVTWCDQRRVLKVLKHQNKKNRQNPLSSTQITAKWSQREGSLLSWATLSAKVSGGASEPASLTTFFSTLISSCFFSRLRTTYGAESWLACNCMQWMGACVDLMPYVQWL